MKRIILCFLAALIGVMGLSSCAASPSTGSVNSTGLVNNMNNIWPLLLFYFFLAVVIVLIVVLAKRRKKEKRIERYFINANIDSGFCPQCGQPVRFGAKFCDLCGAELAKRHQTQDGENEINQ